MFWTTATAAAFLAATLSSGASAQTINGCIKDKNGALRIVADPSACTSRETPLSWNQQGMPGPQGEPGETGAEGPAAAVPHIFDGSGQDLGVFVGEVDGVGFRVLRDDLGVTYLIDPLNGEHASRSVAYAGPVCSGQGYVDAFMSNTVFPSPLSPTSLLIGSKKMWLSTENHQSVAAAPGSRPGEACDEQVASNSYVVEVEQFVGSLGVSFPLPLPIWVGSAGQ